MAYEELRPTIGICFLNASLFPDLPDYHLMFDLRERQRQTLFTDQLQLHILELPKFNKTAGQLTTPLDRWLYFLRHAERLDLNALPQKLDVSEVRWAMEDLLMISQSEIERERYESRLKAQFDAYSLQAEARNAREKGLAEGLQRGLEEGHQKGRQEGLAAGQIARIRSYQRLLRRDITPQEQLGSLSLADLEEMAARLEVELNRNLGNGS